ncbi:MAG: tRNA 4-thiouridine(8) synthase ThiI [Treponema sp.]|nr:tRNA 4-thiouridine(8) synthase ThiI [Treponema sp.]
MSTWLLKPAELTLKGENRKNFENALIRNLKRMLNREAAAVHDPKSSPASVTIRGGRYYVHCAESEKFIVEKVLSRLIGISGWAQTNVCEKTIDSVLQACVKEGKKIFDNGMHTFKIEARRTDKSFPLDSYQLRCEGGRVVCESVDGLKVDIHNPHDIIRIEIRDKAYIYSGGKKGLGGLPVGSAGRGLLLLSGGIDSPVAGFLMACRGMSIDAIHFHTYPYTSLEAKEKVIKLAGILGSYCMGIRLYIISFTEVQARIKERSPPPWSTVLMRMAMMEAGEKTALKIKSKCLISGESLSQVASQTIENLTCIQSRIKIPVLRPLIGTDKINIIRNAQSIGTYDTSILPYEDCCVLFTPHHPILRGSNTQANELYETLELGPLIEKALENHELAEF